MGGLGQLYPAGTPTIMPPTDLPYLAALFRECRLPCITLDCLGSGIDAGDLLLAIKRDRPRLVALRTSLPSLEWDLKLAELVRTIVDTELIMFGPCLKYLGDLALRDGHVDAVVPGEAELVLPKLAAATPGSLVAGVVRRGSPVADDVSGRIEDLDALPFPAWDLLPYHNYHCLGLVRNLRPFVTVLSSRGCPHGCAYCPYPVVQGRKMRLRSAQNVVEELAWLDHRLGVRAVLFRDPEFAINRDRVAAICEGMFQRSLALSWRCETRIENLDPELLSLMARAGCVGINLGIESANEEILRGVGRKSFPFEKARTLVDYCHRLGIETFCFFVLGLPGENWRSAMSTIDYALALAPRAVQFTVATPYPGTGLWEWASGHDFIEEGSFSALTGYEATMRTEHLQVDELALLRDYAYRAWSMRGTVPWFRIAGCVRNLGRELRAAASFLMERRELRGKSATCGTGVANG
jgi:radical SAM superfamily enzyme YgiQ (UPF0313 family)